MNVGLRARTIASALFTILGAQVHLFSQSAEHQQLAAAQTSSLAAAQAQSQGSEVRVAVVILPPMVMEENGRLGGFTIDLWGATAARLKLKTSYVVLPDGHSLEEAMRAGSADLTPSIFITSTRDEEFDFSYPIMDEGLQIMVRETDAGTKPIRRPMRDMLELLFSRTTGLWMCVAVLLVIIPAHVVWFLERGHEGGLIANRKYFPGIFEAAFWGLSTLASQAEGMPRQWLARSLSVFWMFSGVVFIASYTAQLTTTLTVEQIRGAIEGPSDLPGKQVATLANSVVADYLREQNAQVHEFPSDQMFTALLDKKVDAVVAPSSLLNYYAAHDGRGFVKTVGPVFDSRPVAIMLQMNSPLRKKIDGALIALRDDGTYQRLYAKWFGVP